MKKEKKIEGISLSWGIAFGKPYIFDRKEAPYPLQSKKINVDQEVSRFRHALGLSRIDLCLLQQSFVHQANKDSQEVVDILDTHLAILQDPFIEKIEEQIRASPNGTAESVFSQAINDYKKKFSCNKDQFFAQRIGDVMDVSRRVLRHLVAKNDSQKESVAIPKGAILIAKDFSPSMIAEINGNVSGLIAKKGGPSSHSAIIAKAKCLPYVGGIDFTNWEEVEEIVVDAQEGIVILNPTQSTKKAYEKLSAERKQAAENLEKKAFLPTVTKEQVPIELWANIDDPTQLKTLPEHVVGIGLYRSEGMILEGKTFPSEEVQYQTYVSLLQKACGKPVTIRVFDVGDDKIVPGLNLLSSPSFGSRGIRFLLREKAVFAQQIRAVLRACVFGQLRILFPMVADVKEFLLIKGMIQTIATDLEKRYDFCFSNISFGTMIELPCAALFAESIAKESDFLSIGSNDLIQYTLGVDRQNAELQKEYNGYHPSILYLIKRIVQAGEKQNTPVLLCGELGSDIKALMLLLGLGVRKFSLCLGKVYTVAHLIEKISLEEAKNLANQALQKHTSEEVIQLVDSYC